MASINYCFTVCRAAGEKIQQETHSHASASAIDIPTPTSPGVSFFGRVLSFGLTPPLSTSAISNAFTVKASQSNEIDDNVL